MLQVYFQLDPFCGARTLDFSFNYFSEEQPVGKYWSRNIRNTVIDIDFSLTFSTRTSLHTFFIVPFISSKNLLHYIG